MPPADPKDLSRRSLSEVHESVPVPPPFSFWRRLFAFAGPAYLVSVGYMDPGNWATDIAAGSRFGYGLLWVLLMSNVMAVLLQSLSARLGIVVGADLAQASRAMFGRRISFVLWILAEVAIAACDLAEVLGAAIGLHLLFGLPLIVGVFVTALDSFILLALHARGVRLMEAFIIALVITIGVCLGLEIVLSRPDWGPIASGFVPSLPGEGALYLAIGILGATVMPHNLYLHSALVQSRRVARTPGGIRSGLRFNIVDSVVALNGAFFVNAALLVMAAATFYRAGLHEVTDIQEAHRLLEPIVGSGLAPVAFAIALIASGQASTITGTLAGQIVMEGFVRIRMRPIARRMLTRAVAIVPAVATIALFGDAATGDLLVLSQVVLALQLSFAVIPLVHVVSDRRWMGRYAIGPVLQTCAWATVLVIASLNIALAGSEIAGWLRGAGDHVWLVRLTVMPVAAGLCWLLLYVMVVPAWQRWRGKPASLPPGVHGAPTMPELEPSHLPQLIAAAVDFTPADRAVLSYALGLARASGRGTRILLLHVVESGGARLFGGEDLGSETLSDRQHLDVYATELGELGVETAVDLGHGVPADELAVLVGRHRPDLVIVGSHGHKRLGDLVLGTSIERLRHKISVPLLVVPTSAAPG